MAKTASSKTIRLRCKDGKWHVRALDPSTVNIEFGTIVCKDKDGNVVQTISLQRYVEGMNAIACVFPGWARLRYKKCHLTDLTKPLMVRR